MRLIVALSVAVVLAVFLLYTSFAGGATPSIRPSQLNDNLNEKVSLAGIVVGPVEGDARGDGMRFLLKDFDGDTTAEVVYTGRVPDLFKEGRHVFLEGGTWEPLRPVQASRTGDRIRVRFHVPEPPLVFDTTLVSDPGNFGFEFLDDSGATPTIRSVQLLDEDTIEIRLSATPKSTAAKFVAYAFTGIPGNAAGPRTGARGNLRDSDDSRSRHGNKLYNWCVHFEIPVK